MRGYRIKYEEKKRIPVGVENFEQLIKGNYYYVDKSWQIFLKYQGGSSPPFCISFFIFPAPDYASAPAC